jgi:hypothetical protein
MASMPGSILLSADAPVGRRAARRIAALIVWAWVAAAGGLGICTFILFSLSAPWFGAVSLLLGIGALVRAVSLRRKISAIRSKPLRLLPGMPSGAANASPAGASCSPAHDRTPQSPALNFSDAPSSLAAAKTGSPQLSSLAGQPAGGTQADLDAFMGHPLAGARFTERELQDLGLDQWEPDAYRPPADQGGPGIGLWIGVGIVVLIGVVVVRRRSGRVKSADVGADSAEEPSAVVPPPGRDVAKIPHSSLGEGTTSSLSGVPGSGSTARSTAGFDAAVVPPTSSDTASQPSRLGRFTPSPKLARFAVVPLFASFVLAYFAIRTAGSNTMSLAIPLAGASFVALGLAFYLAPAS